MANHIQQLLNTWHSQKDELQWVLATIIATDGSSYRKPGAMMMINSLGKYYGLLSGGCLESDIMLQSRKCWDTNLQQVIQYDMREEEDLAWQLGIGCGGLVRILLQPVTQHNDYLALLELRQHINNNLTCQYCQDIESDEAPNTVHIVTNHTHGAIPICADSNRQAHIFQQLIKPPPHIAIFGGGTDALPVANMAANMGWQVSLVDPRTGYARASEFSQVTRIIQKPINDIQNDHWLQSIDAIVIMMHNITLDAQALILAQKSAAKYLGLLGPVHRTDRVLQAANTTRDALTKPVANPIGLRLGGDLPESIALSILAEIHAFIFQADGQSISSVLNKNDRE